MNLISIDYDMECYITYNNKKVYNFLMGKLLEHTAEPSDVDIILDIPHTKRYNILHVNDGKLRGVEKGRSFRSAAITFMIFYYTIKLFA